jgi:hypothetical protein
MLNRLIDYKSIDVRSLENFTRDTPHSGLCAGLERLYELRQHTEDRYVEARVQRVII